MELLMVAEMLTLVLPVISIGSDVQTPSPVVELLLILISLFNTENRVVDGLVVIDQLLPVPDVVPLGRVKFSDQAIPVLVLFMVTVADAVLVHPFIGLVTVKL